MSSTQRNSLSLELLENNGGICKAAVRVPAELVDHVYKFAASHQALSVETYGFHRTLTTPTGYIEQNFKGSLCEHLKEFLFKYVVSDFLYQELRRKKIILAEEPRLIDIVFTPAQDAFFYLKFATAEPIPKRDWRYIPFKPPVRKKYKDLDRRAKDFIEEETAREVNYTQKDIVNPRDWIAFDITLMQDSLNSQPVIDMYKKRLWLKIGSDETNLAYQELFIGKHKGEKFYTNSRCLQDLMSGQIDTNYCFLVEIVDIIPNPFFSLDSFKQHFKLKTNKSIHHKLIEVFSCNNDLSLRHAIVDSVFDVLLMHHNIQVPSPSVLRRKKTIIELLLLDPDYQVYKREQGFDEKVSRLAEKQLKEVALIDFISYHENIRVSDDDVRHYLNLAQRPRMKEFIYFKHPAIRAGEQEYPVCAETLRHLSLREKTLNYVINQLSEE
jgi:FKBP-type peptidyl-prolyl cis-trans isomerase (trigger factor)